MTLQNDDHTSSTARADMLIPPAHPFRVHLGDIARTEAAEGSSRLWEPTDGPLPALYVSHGAPPTFEDVAWMRELYLWARSFPKPRSILIISAHWEAAPLCLSSAEPRDLVYDFAGFAPLYFGMRYDTPPGAELIARVAGALPSGEEVYEHRSRGIDHGAWVPLKIMYPEADVPVAQLSLPTQDPGRLLELGRRLRELRAEGTLVIGSGFMTHGLQFITREMLLGSVPTWSSDFDAWASSALERGDVDELLRFRTAAPGVRYAHPTVEHFSPLFVTLGAAADPEAGVETAIDGYMYGLSKRSFQVD